MNNECLKSFPEIKQKDEISLLKKFSLKSLVS